MALVSYYQLLDAVIKPPEYQTTLSFFQLAFFGRQVPTRGGFSGAMPMTRRSGVRDDVRTDRHSEPATADNKDYVRS